MRAAAIVLGMTCLAPAAISAPDIVWDVDWAKSAPLEVEVASESVERHNDVDLIVRELSFLSHEWNGTAIRIAGHLAAPVAARTTPLPAMVMVTASPTDARNLAASGGIVALAIDRVGEGESTGPKDIYENWLDLEPDKDIRNSWMYHFVMSAIRAVTYLTTLDMVDTGSIGVTGTSRGGLCSLLTSAADDRIALAMPVAATGDYDRTVSTQDNWLESLVIRPTGRTPESVAWKRFVAQYDPAHFVDRLHGMVWIVNGAQDEFFPIGSNVPFASAPRVRFGVIYDGDHGYFGQASGIYETYDNGKAIWVRVGANLARGVHAVLHGRDDLPATPVIEGALRESSSDERVRFEVRIDRNARVRAAQGIYSTDGSWTFRRVPLALGDDGLWRAEGDAPAGCSIAAFVEVEYGDDAGSYYLTSVPKLVPGEGESAYTTRIRPAPTF